MWLIPARMGTFLATPLRSNARVLEDGGTLTFLLDATREIARRVLGEVREAVNRVAPNAKIAGL
jgi:hypothetical protein